jgi:hypothetical protein
MAPSSTNFIRSGIRPQLTPNSGTFLPFLANQFRTPSFSPSDPQTACSQRLTKTFMAPSFANFIRSGISPQLTRALFPPLSLNYQPDLWVPQRDIPVRNSKQPRENLWSPISLISFDLRSDHTPKPPRPFFPPSLTKSNEVRRRQFRSLRISAARRDNPVRERQTANCQPQTKNFMDPFCDNSEPKTLVLAFRRFSIYHLRFTRVNKVGSTSCC